MSRSITAREHTQILTALRSTTMRVPEIAKAANCTVARVESVARVNHIETKGRK